MATGSTPGRDPCLRRFGSHLDFCPIWQDTCPVRQDDLLPSGTRLTTQSACFASGMKLAFMYKRGAHEPALSEIGSPLLLPGERIGCGCYPPPVLSPEPLTHPFSSWQFERIASCTGLMQFAGGSSCALIDPITSRHRVILSPGRSHQTSRQLSLGCNEARVAVGLLSIFSGCFSFSLALPVHRFPFVQAFSVESSPTMDRRIGTGKRCQSLLSSITNPIPVIDLCPSRP